MESAIGGKTTEIGANNGPNKDVPKAQDLHEMMSMILSSHMELQNSGFFWDLNCRNKVHKDVEFVLFAPFVHLDSDEAEKLCGKFTSRTSNVKQPCRHCTCPMEETDEPWAVHPLKTQQQIGALVAHNQVLELCNMSQHCIKNAAHLLRFGSHILQGIHGACPMDMLRALHLGTFHHVRERFLDQIGPTSDLAGEINAVAVRIGELLLRQSDGDLPRTRFPGGVNRGKLNAKDFPGILLCLAATLTSTLIHVKLAKKRGKWKHHSVIKDWITLLETLLQWEQWLKSSEMKVKHVRQAQTKHRIIMCFLKKLCAVQQEWD